MSNELPDEWLRLRELANAGDQEALKKLRRLVRDRWKRNVKKLARRRPLK